MVQPAGTDAGFKRCAHHQPRHSLLQLAQERPGVTLQRGPAHLPSSPGLLPLRVEAQSLIERHRDLLEGDVAYARGKRAGRVARRRLADARRLAEQDDRRAFYAEVARALTGPVPGARPVWYQKHMAHHLLRGDDLGFLDQLVNCFLIRSPREVIVSYSKVDVASSPARDLMT